MNWIALTEEEQIQFINEETSALNKTIAIFKHSTRCSISSMVKSRLESSWDVAMPIYYLDLLNYREISNLIAEKYQVTHESPQLLLIKNGKCVYHDSHTAISSAEVKKQLNSL